MLALRVVCAVVGFVLLTVSFAIGSPGVARAATSGVTPLGQVTADMKGEPVTVQGTIVGFDNWSSGFLIAINDGTGQLNLSMSENTYATLKQADQLKFGAVVQVDGRVYVSRDVPQVVLTKAKSLTIVQPPPATTVRKYQLGGMNGNDHGAWVWVEGNVVYTEQGDSGFTVYLADSTGVQKVVFKDVVLRHLTNAALLTSGQHLSVIGHVRAVRGSGIEIRVILPNAVQFGAPTSAPAGTVSGTS